jgi:cytochrome P450
VWSGRKFAQTKAQQEAGFDNIIDLQESSLHAQLRKPWNKAFSAEPLKGYEAALIRRIRQMNTQLRLITEESNDGVGKIDASKWICYFA